MNTAKTALWALVGLLITVSACKTPYETLLASNDVDAKYAAAMDFFQQKKYQKAAQLFESMSVLTNGTARDDTVQYYWGLSVAQVQYQKLQEQQQTYQEYVLRKQQEMAEEQQVMMNQIADAIATYVKEYNTTHNYALILTTAGNVITTPVVTGDPRLDITDELLAGLNAAYISTKESSK